MAKYRVFYAAVVTALFAGYLFFPGYFFWLALVSTLILPFFSLLLTWLAIRNSAPQLTCDQPIGRKGSPVDFIFLLSGRSRLPVARITLLLRIQSSLSAEGSTEKICFSVKSMRSFSLVQKCTPLTCGQFSCTVEQIRFWDYLGLFSFTKKGPCSAYTEVLPDMTALDFAARPSSPGESLLLAQKGNFNGESSQVRPYQNGDSLRTVHWKLSAKQEKILVRESFAAQDCGLAIYLDFCGRNMDLDCLLEALGILGSTLSFNHVPYRLQWYSSKDQRVRSEAIWALENLTHALHLLLGEPPCSGHTLMHLPASPVHTLAVLTADSKALSSLSLPATLRTLLLLTINPQSPAQPQSGSPHCHIRHQTITATHIRENLSEALSSLQDQP